MERPPKKLVEPRILHIMAVKGRLPAASPFRKGARHKCETLRGRASNKT